jgi:hypothetical protein
MHYGGNMHKAKILLLVVTTLAAAILFNSQMANAAEDVYLEGAMGHFKLRSGKVYHWEWKGVETAPRKSGLPGKETGAMVSPAPAMKPTAVEEAAPAAKVMPEVMKEPPATEAEPLERITRADMEQALSGIAKAANNKDIRGIASYLSDDLVVFLTMELPSGRQDLRMNKNEYLHKLEKTFSKQALYKYRSDNVKIDIGADGMSATVEEDIHETFGTLEMRTGSATHQQSAVELRRGRIVVTKIVATQK